MPAEGSRQPPMCHLGDHIELTAGFAFKSNLFTDDPHDIPLVKGSNVQQGFIDWQSAPCWPRHERDKYARFLLRPNDVVVAMDRPWVSSGLKYAWIRPGDPEGLLVQRVARLRATAGLDQNFLRYIVGSPNFAAYLRQIVTGVNVPHVSGDQIRRFSIRLLPLKEQRRVAAILGALDDLIDNNKRRIELLEEMAQAIYREWFVNFRFPGHGHVELVNSELGGIPRGWRVKALLDVADVQYGHPFKSKLFKEGSEGLGVIRIRDVPRRRTETHTTEEGRKKFLVEAKDILVGMDGNFHMCHWPGPVSYLNQRVARFRSPQLPYSYLFLALKKPIGDYNRTLTGTTVAHLLHRHVKEIKLVVPDDTTLRAAERLLDPMLDLQSALFRENVQLGGTRDLLLPKLVSGKIDVSDLDIDTSGLAA